MQNIKLVKIMFSIIFLYFYTRIPVFKRNNVFQILIYCFSFESIVNCQDCLNLDINFISQSKNIDHLEMTRYQCISSTPNDESRRMGNGFGHQDVSTLVLSSSSRTYKQSTAPFDSVA